MRIWCGKHYENLISAAFVVLVSCQMECATNSVLKAIICLKPER